MSDYIYPFLYCLSIALQLSGALILLSAMKSIDQIVDGVLSPSDYSIGTYNKDKTLILLNPQKVQAAFANHYYQKFAMWYILTGYLGAVWFGEWSLSGFSKMFLIALLSFVILLISISFAKQKAKKEAPKYYTLPADQIPSGAMVVELEEL